MQGAEKGWYEECDLAVGVGKRRITVEAERCEEYPARQGWQGKIRGQLPAHREAQANAGEMMLTLLERQKTRGAEQCQRPVQ